MNIIDNIARDARQLNHVPILPSEGPLMDDHYTDVRDAYASFVFRYGITNAQACKKIGISAATLSQWQNGRYGGDVDKVTRRVASWVERDRKARDSRVEIPYIPTKIAESMRAVVQLACQQRQMAAIVAPAGSGKTKLLDVLCDELSGFYLYGDKDLTAMGMMLDLGEKTRAVFKGRGVCNIKSAIISKIKDSDRPIFVDEAHLLHRDLLSSLRSIHDQAKVPIIMTGAYEILRAVDDRAAGRGQLHSRCIVFNALEHFANIEDGGHDGGLGKPLFTIEEIKRLFSHIPVKLNAATIEMLWAIACLPDRGCLRTVKNIVTFCSLSFGSERVITLDHLDQVMRTLFSMRSQEIMCAAQKHRQKFREVA